MQQAESRLCNVIFNVTIEWMLRQLLLAPLARPLATDCNPEFVNLSKAMETKIKAVRVHLSYMHVY